MKRTLTFIIVFAFCFSYAYSQNLKERVANRYLQRAEKYLKQKDYFLARRFFERAYRKFKIIKNHKGQFLALKRIGDVNMLKGYFDRGFDMYQRAGYFARRSGMIYTIVYIELCRNMARIHETRKYYKHAVVFMKLAVDIGVKIGANTISYDSKYLSKLKKLRKKHGDIAR